MDRVRGPIEKIYYGHDNQTLFLAFEGQIAALEKQGQYLEIIIEQTGEHLRFSMDKPYKDNDTTFIIGERMELALSRRHFQEHSTVHLRFEIVRGNEIIQTMPGYGALSVDMDESYASNWFV